MYAQVVVLTYQAPDINYFTYLVPKNLEREIKVGQLVKVPFGKRNPMGVVVGLQVSHPEQREGSQDSFANAQNDKSKNQNDKKVVIKPISRIVLSTPLLLPFQLELLKWMSAYYFAPMINCLKAILPAEALNVKCLTTNAATSYQLLATSYQTIILVPTINHIPETLAKFPKAKNYAIYHHELKRAEKFNTWLEILSGKCDFIFGSRSAIFSPCPNVCKIIIYDEHDGAYKDERSPYFDTLTVAQKISDLTRAQIKIVDSSPKITTYFNYKTHLKGEISRVNSKIISMQDEKLRGNFSHLSSYLKSEIIKRKKMGGNVLLFLNKKKEAGSLYCKNCNFNDYFEKQPDACPKCKSPDFYFNVLNTESLKKEIPENSQLLSIATASIFYSPITTKFDLIAYIQPDPLLARADFSSVETLYEQITNLKKMLNENGQLIIQTYNPDDDILKSATSGDFAKFYKNQLEMRRSLSYPPFALLVKLTIKGEKEEKVESEAEKTFSLLNSTIQPADRQTIQLLGPFQPIFFRKKTTYNIIIKYKLDDYSLKSKEKALEKLSLILKKVPKNFQIVVEPMSLN